ncbi:MAG TPA: sulfite exporter TauE/SafE family protein [Bacteroidia bacterium]|nr:sulfite exporter TauE/SafE family protein [Bacteroidia bacterium]HNU34858.1 sulfite exporter TauE/SafE family protein [Bacteroidia bacterium]
MTDSFFISAFLLGFLGSFHCVGMCGPLALMLPVNNSSKASIISGRLLYNAGRITTYIALGFLLGTIGLAASIKGFQKELSVATGVMILATVILSLGKKQKAKAYELTTSFTSPLRRTLKRLFQKKSYLSLFFIGMINGLLPCGFVYIAIAGALATGNYLSGAVYMMFFGAGTIPVMFFISSSTSFLSLKSRNILNKLTPLVAIVIAILLISRGSQSEKNCCNKTTQIMHKN